ncbi:MAG: MFS transporter [Pseudomonadota bacterium]
MGPLILSVTALVASLAILLTGNSLQFVILAVRADIEGFSVESMGLISAGYFGGFALGCIFCPRLIRMVGHIRAFAALASIASGAVLAHPLLPDVVAWLLFRVMTGFCFAGMYMVVESWLNARATNQLRGRLLSIYGAVTFGAYALGPLLSGLGSLEGFFLFVLASILMSFAIVPITLTRANPPMPAHEQDDRSFSPWQLYRRSPLGMIASIFNGIAIGGCTGLIAVFGNQMALSTQELSLLMTSMMAGGFVLQYPLGWLSDKFDRRTVMLGIALAGGGAAILFTLALFSGLSMFILILAGATLVGGLIFPLHAITIAHTNDWLAENEYVAAAAALSFVFSIGSMIGSAAGSWFMGLFGAPALFGFVALVMGALSLFIIVRMFVREAPVSDDTTANVATSLMTPYVLPVDYAVLDDQLEFDFSAPITEIETEPANAGSDPPTST